MATRPTEKLWDIQRRMGSGNKSRDRSDRPSGKRETSKHGTRHIESPSGGKRPIQEGASPPSKTHKRKRSPNCNREPQQRLTPDAETPEPLRQASPERRRSGSPRPRRDTHTPERRRRSPRPTSRGTRKDGNSSSSSKEQQSPPKHKPRTSRHRLDTHTRPRRSSESPTTMPH
eukprot:g20500.t1